MLRAYFDDAGTHAGAPIVVMGGLIGAADQWEQLEREWLKQLSDPLPEVGKPPLKMFHMAACESADGEFANYKPAERMLVAQHFRDIIARTDLVSTASGVDPEAWEEIANGPVRDFLGPASEVCFEHCLARVQDYIFDHSDHKVAVLFDKGIENQRLHDVIQLYRDHADSRVEFCSIGFGKVIEFCPLQAADIVATQNYWLAQEWLGIRPSGKDPDVAFRHSFRKKQFEGMILDRSAIAAEVARRGPDGRLRPVANVLMTTGNR